MTAALLAGCGSSAQQSAAGGSTAAASSAASQDRESSPEGGDGKTVKIGVYGPVTGGSAVYGEGAQNAINMAVEEINDGDSGYKIEIVNGGKIVDDGGDAKQAINAYNSLMKESPDAIVGSFFSSVTLPVAEQAPKTICSFLQQVLPIKT